MYVTLHVRAPLFRYPRIEETDFRLVRVSFCVSGSVHSQVGCFANMVRMAGNEWWGGRGSVAGGSGFTPRAAASLSLSRKARTWAIYEVRRAHARSSVNLPPSPLLPPSRSSGRPPLDYGGVFGPLRPPCPVPPIPRYIYTVRLPQSSNTITALGVLPSPPSRSSSKILPHPFRGRPPARIWREALLRCAVMISPVVPRAESYIIQCFECMNSLTHSFQKCPFPPNVIFRTDFCCKSRLCLSKKQITKIRFKTV